MWKYCGFLIQYNTIQYNMIKKKDAFLIRSFFFFLSNLWRFFGRFFGYNIMQYNTIQYTVKNLNNQSTNQPEIKKCGNIAVF